jgi:hypothetical protein
VPTITLSVNEELKKDMDNIQFVNWSAVAREAIKEKIEKLKLMDEITSKSKLTEKDALEIGKKVNKALHKEYMKGK